MRRIDICMVMIVLVFTACEHKDLCYRHPHDEEWSVRFDWDAIPMTDRPSEMRVLFIPVETDTLDASFEFQLPSEGGTVVLPEGDYEVLAFNDDSYVNKVFQYRMKVPDGMGERQWRFVMTTSGEEGKQATKRAPEFFCLEQQTVRLQAGMGSQPLILRPQRHTVRVTYEVNGIRGVGGARRVYGVLTGCSACLDLSSGICLERLVQGKETRLAFPMEVAQGRLQGCFYGLGCGFAPDELGSTAHRHLLEIYLQDADGKYWKLSEDVTDQVPCSPSLSNRMPDFYLRLDLQVHIPEISGDEESQFDPDVDDWEDEEVDIPLG